MKPVNLISSTFIAYLAAIMSFFLSVTTRANNCQSRSDWYTVGGEDKLIGSISEKPQVVKTGDDQYVVLGASSLDLLDLNKRTVRHLLARSNTLTGATLTRLNNGHLLVAGGIVPDGLYAKSAPSSLVYDLKTNSLASTCMIEPRFYHSSVTLDDGRVLVAGGDVYGQNYRYSPTVSTEIFDPKSNAWAVGPTLVAAKAGGSMKLVNGRVYIFGGYDDSQDGWWKTEIIDSKALTNWQVFEGQGMNKNAIISESGQVASCDETDDALICESLSNVLTPKSVSSLSITIDGPPDASSTVVDSSGYLLFTGTGASVGAYYLFKIDLSSNDIRAMPIPPTESQLKGATLFSNNTSLIVVGGVDQDHPQHMDNFGRRVMTFDLSTSTWRAL
jgi:hypothetical protein